MEISVTFLLTGCLIQGVLCGFSISLPERVEALQGSCVFIPCTFDIEEKHKHDLTDNTKRIWTTATVPSVVVFNSSSPNSGQLKGEILGSPTEKNCTTRFDNLSLADKGSYWFRLEGSGGLKYSYTTPTVNIDIRESPPKPTVHQLQDEQQMMEGNSVTLHCSIKIKIFCASRPPSLTWSSTPEHLIKEHVTQKQHQNQTHLFSDLSFILTLSHHRTTFTCTATYQLKQQTTTYRTHQLNVQYPPKSTSAHVHPAGVVVEGGSVTLSCSSDGNPAVNYTWYRHTEGELKPVQSGPNLTISNINSSHSGRYYCTAQNQHGIQKISVLLDVQFPPKISSSCSRNGKLTCTCEAHGNPLPNLQWRLSGKNFSSPAETSITKENNISLKRTLSIQLTDSDVLQCFSVNIHGSASHQFQPFTKPQEMGVHHPSMLLGFVIGASIFLILCVLTVCKERRKHRRPLDNRQDDTSGLIMTESAVMSDRGGHYAYANKSLQYTQSTWGSLHYSTIDFTNIEPVSEEVRGLSTLTEEYATIRHQTTETHTTPVSAEKTTPPEEMIYENMSHNSVIAENISIVEQTEGH